MWHFFPYNLKILGKAFLVSMGNAFDKLMVDFEIKTIASFSLLSDGI